MARKALSSRALYVIAQLSYSMYLFHILIILGFTGWSLMADISVAMVMLVGGIISFPLRSSPRLGSTFCRASRYRVEESVTRL